MCSEQTAKSSSIARNCSTPARYRGWSPTAVGPTWVSTGVPDAQMRSPSVAAATEAAVRQPHEFCTQSIRLDAAAAS